MEGAHSNYNNSSGSSKQKKKPLYNPRASSIHPSNRFPNRTTAKEYSWLEGGWRCWVEWANAREVLHFILWKPHFLALALPSSSVSCQRDPLQCGSEKKLATKILYRWRRGWLRIRKKKWRKDKWINFWIYFHLSDKRIRKKQCRKRQLGGLWNETTHLL